MCTQCVICRQRLMFPFWSRLGLRCVVWDSFPAGWIYAAHIPCTAYHDGGALGRSRLSAVYRDVSGACIAAAAVVVGGVAFGGGFGGRASNGAPSAGPSVLFGLLATPRRTKRWAYVAAGQDPGPHEFERTRQARGYNCKTWWNSRLGTFFRGFDLYSAGPAQTKSQRAVRCR